ncbi:hypothetical protein NM688_g6430 [Phlebia brevispora]|uniref:Uncharacterized protein n=1 Tax=Phlebia brevispora TaxID=194682 RepID=A0ACC1SG74_9APHY|nr:hypothetical protein NM688_g6430 [Phlebia brevispora]
MIAAALALLPLTLGVFASPLPDISARQIFLKPWCSGLGVGAFDVAYNFTLAAYNSTLPNSNTTGVPLVVGWNGATEEAELKVLSTYASYPYNDFPTFSMVNGTLHPNSPNNLSIVDNVVSDGDEPSFLQTNEPATAAQIYCGVADTDPAGGGTGFPELAVNSDTDSFFLCSTGDYRFAQNNIVYKPNLNSYSYNYSSCYPVKIQIIGLF